MLTTASIANEAQPYNKLNQFLKEAEHRYMETPFDTKQSILKKL